MKRLPFAVLLALSVGACTPIPPPKVVADADAVSTSKAALDAKALAPQAYAAAMKLLGEAHEEVAHGLPAHAQILAERAIAAFEEAESLARLARAERRGAEAGEKSDRAEKALDTLTADLERARVDVDTLERDLRVLKDAALAGSSGPATPEQLAARRQTSQSFLMQAKFMCAAARMLAASTKDPASFDADLGGADADVTKLEGELAKADASPLDLAAQARAGCLDVLTKVRRANVAVSVGAGTNSGNAETDALLGELSSYASRVGGGLRPERDERGVVVSMRSVWDGDHLSADAKTRLAELDRVAAQHPRFGVAIVVHSDAPIPAADQSKWSARATEIATLFGSVPQSRLLQLVAGNFSPVADPQGRDKTRNARVEIVFIAAEP